jgi:hypothetical protein
MAKVYADLSSSLIDLDYIREAAQRSLLTALDSRRGRKALVLDPRLGGPLMQICQFSTLRQHNVDKLYYLEGGTLVGSALPGLRLVMSTVTWRPYWLSSIECVVCGCHSRVSDCMLAVINFCFDCRIT